MNFKNLFQSIFGYTPPVEYNFELPNEDEIQHDLNTVKPKEPVKIYPSLNVNIEYLRTRYNLLINSDIILREFTLNARGKQYNCILLYIDGMVDSNLLDDFVLKPLMLRNTVEQVSDFDELAKGVNSGNCALIIDTLNVAFDIEVKGFKQRSVDTPENEIVIKGPHEAFVENIRTNTSLLRRIVNNEDLIIENLEVGKITKTKCAVCYMKDITNSNN